MTFFGFLYIFIIKHNHILQLYYNIAEDYIT